MGKNQKYKDEQLLEAVIKYSEICKKKIKATELAEWCRGNIEGLEEVKYYHFMRPINVRDEKSGKMKQQSKLCTKKIEEINKARSLVAGVKTNILLQSSNIDTFFEQPKVAQRKIVAETRELVDKVMTKNVILERENKALGSISKQQKQTIAEISEKVNALQKAQKKLIKQVNFLMKVTDERSRKEALSKIGIFDGSLDLDVYVQSLQRTLNEIKNMDKILAEHISDSAYSERKEGSENGTSEEDKSLAEEVLSGLDFD